MVDPVELLSLLAELSLGLAGFSGVVVAFGSSAGKPWREDDRFRVEALLVYSIGPLTYALLALGLLAAELAPSTVWTLASVLLASVIAGSTVSFRRTAVRLAVDPNARVTPIGIRVIQTIALTSVALLLANVAWMHAFWPSFAVGAILLLEGAVVFGRLLLLR